MNKQHTKQWNGQVGNDHFSQHHGEEHVKKLFSTTVIVNEDTHSNLVRGHCFTGEDTNIFHPWSLKLDGFFRNPPISHFIWLPICSFIPLGVATLLTIAVEQSVLVNL